MAQKKLDDVQNKVGELANKVDAKEVEIGGRKFTGLQLVLFIASIVGIMICPLSSRQVKYLKISTDYTYILIEM